VERDLRITNTMQQSGKEWTRMDIETPEDENVRSTSRVPTKRIVCTLSTLVLVYVLCSLRIVPPAHVGLPVTFGSVSTSQLESGIHVLNPFSSVININLKTQLIYSENIVPTKEGLNVELDVSLLYHVEKSSVRDIFLQLGERYEEVLITPELQSAVRGLTSEVSAKALYTSGRLEIRLWDTFSSVRSVHLMASLAGILLMTLWERLQETRLVFCISMKIASGTCCSWQSDKSRLLFSLASSHLCTTFTTPFPIIFTHLAVLCACLLLDSATMGSAEASPSKDPSKTIVAIRSWLFVLVASSTSLM